MRYSGFHDSHFLYASWSCSLHRFWSPAMTNFSLNNGPQYKRNIGEPIAFLLQLIFNYRFQKFLTGFTRVFLKNTSSHNYINFKMNINTIHIKPKEVFLELPFTYPQVLLSLLLFWMKYSPSLLTPNLPFQIDHYISANMPVVSIVPFYWRIVLNR